MKYIFVVLNSCNIETLGFAGICRRLGKRIFRLYLTAGMTYCNIAAIAVYDS